MKDVLLPPLAHKRLWGGSRGEGLFFLFAFFAAAVCCLWVVYMSSVFVVASCLLIVVGFRLPSPACSLSGVVVHCCCQFRLSGVGFWQWLAFFIPGFQLWLAFCIFDLQMWLAFLLSVFGSGSLFLIVGFQLWWLAFSIDGFQL